VSLQGTLDTFGLQDVLALLSSTKKKGELRVTGPNFAGSVWMAEGKLCGAEVPRCPTLVDAVFELLRLPEGSFAFEGESPNRAPLPPESVGDVVSDAEERMVEWRDIAALVPSVHVFLRLAPAAPSSQVVLDPDQWRLVVASSMGVTLAEMAEVMGMGEFQIARTAKYLVEHGLATVENAPPPVAEPPKATEKPPPMEVQAPPVAAPASSPAAPADEPAAAPAQTTPPVAAPPVATSPAPQPAAAQAPATQAPAAQGEPPKVVEEETEAPTPGEPVDRSALLKFLSSVRN
jgi:hypothetical protein